MEEFLDSEDHSQGRIADTIATKDCVQRQLDKIRPEYREVINLVHLQDKSYKDAAEELNWDQEQVRAYPNINKLLYSSCR